MSIRKNLKTLKAKYPNAFGATKKALSKGVHTQILQETNLTEAEIKKSVGFWTNNKQYLEAVLTNKHRTNLDGSLSEEITDSDREYSKQKINKLSELTKNLEDGWLFREHTLRKDFPNIFGKQRVPLVNEIGFELAQRYPKVRGNIINHFIRDWKKTKAYNESVLEHSHMYNLSGITELAVTTEMRLKSEKLLKSYNKKKGQKNNEK